MSIVKLTYLKVSFTAEVRGGYMELIWPPSATVTVTPMDDPSWPV